MTIAQAFILGIVQGLTEFLPVSSSAHLVLVPFLLDWKLDVAIAFAFDVIVQVGTLAGVIAYFWKDLTEIAFGFIDGLIQRQPFTSNNSKLAWLLILASVPAGTLGLLLKNLVEDAFASPFATAIFLLVTAAILTFAEYNNKLSPGHDKTSIYNLNWVDAMVMGFGQAFAIFPGISRSGATITAGMLRKLDRTSAARFSFLMSIPIMIAAGVLATLDLLTGPVSAKAYLPIGIGFITSGVTGYLAIAWFLRYLTRHSLTAFAWYCAAAGSITLTIFYLR